MFFFFLSFFLQTRPESRSHHPKYLLNKVIQVHCGERGGKNHFICSCIPLKHYLIFLSSQFTGVIHVLRFWVFFFFLKPMSFGVSWDFWNLLSFVCLIAHFPLNLCPYCVLTQTGTSCKSIKPLMSVCMYTHFVFRHASSDPAVS